MLKKKHSPSVSRRKPVRPVGKPKTIDEYIAKVSGEQRRALDELRRGLRSLLPQAEECISYGMPAFRLEGRIVAGFAATSKGGSYYPFSGSTLASLSSELKGYSSTKSALHFTTQAPLPPALVRKLVKARVAEG
ncbi:MAG: DUF1801 domain-containing protein [Planctomycetes bacterium]|nr:DUF1801 domain-containing protein [Planctomycetota bacterium]